MIQMYPAVVNSPPTMILGALSATDTVITVLDDTHIPEPPNLLVIGGNSVQAETVLLKAKNGTVLTVERGYQGVARAWNANTIIARNFTAYDHDALVANIQSLILRLSAMAHVYVVGRRVFVKVDENGNAGGDFGAGGGDGGEGGINLLNMSVLAQLSENAGALTFKQTPVGITKDENEELITHVATPATGAGADVSAEAAALAADYYNSGGVGSGAGADADGGAVNDYYQKGDEENV